MTHKCDQTTSIYFHQKLVEQTDGWMRYQVVCKSSDAPVKIFVSQDRILFKNNCLLSIPGGWPVCISLGKKPGLLGGVCCFFQRIVHIVLSTAITTELVRWVCHPCKQYTFTQNIGSDCDLGGLKNNKYVEQYCWHLTQWMVESAFLIPSQSYCFLHATVAAALGL